jgi:DNA-binding NarL/FixJ family response regulator
MSTGNIANPLLKVIVADDHRFFRSGIIMALNELQVIEQVEEAENGKDVLQLLESGHFDLVLMDISMPVMNGIVTTKEITKKFPDTKVIAISMYEDDQHIIEMFQNGAKGYLFKNTDKEEIGYALNEVVTNDRLYWPKKLGDKLFNKIILKKQAAKTEYCELFSDREKEIIKLICNELSTKEIASVLNLSQKTVAWHRENLMMKAQTKNTAGLVAFAFTHDIMK